MTSSIVSVLSDEQKISVKMMFDHKVIEKMNLRIQYHAIHKDPSIRQKIDEYRLSCSDEMGSEKCTQTNKYSEYPEAMSVEYLDAEKYHQERTRYIDTMMLEYLDYMELYSKTNHLYIIFGDTKDMETQEVIPFGNNIENNNYLYTMNIHSIINDKEKIKKEFENLYEKIKDKFKEFKEKKQKQKINTGSDTSIYKPIQSIVFLKSSPELYSFHFSDNKRINTLSKLKVTYEKEEIFSRSHSKNVDEYIKSFITSHNKYNYEKDEQSLYMYEKPYKHSDILNIDLTKHTVNKKLEDNIVKIKDLSYNFDDFITYFMDRPIYPKESNIESGILFNESILNKMKNDSRFQNFFQEQNKNHMISKNFSIHKISIYLLQSFYKEYILNKPVLKSILPSISKNIKSFKILYKKKYISLKDDDSKYYDSRIKPFELTTNDKRFQYRIHTKKEDFTIHAFEQSIGPIHAVVLKNSKEEKKTYTLIITSSSLPCSVEIQKRENDENESKIKGLLYLDDVIKTNIVQHKNLLHKNIHPSNGNKSLFYYKPGFEFEKHALEDYYKSKFKTKEIEEGAYKKMVGEIVSDKNQLSFFFIFCENEKKYKHLTEKKGQDSRLSILRNILQINSCFYDQSNTKENECPYKIYSVEVHENIMSGGASTDVEDSIIVKYNTFVKILNIQGNFDSELKESQDKVTINRNIENVLKYDGNIINQIKKYDGENKRNLLILCAELRTYLNDEKNRDKCIIEEPKTTLFTIPSFISKKKILQCSFNETNKEKDIYINIVLYKKPSTKKEIEDKEPLNCKKRRNIIWNNLSKKWDKIQRRINLQSKKNVLYGGKNKKTRKRCPRHKKRTRRKYIKRKSIRKQRSKR